jgi:hypothetical protein
VVAKRLLEPLIAVIRHGAPANDPDARDPRRMLPGDVWAPRGPTFTIESFDDLRALPPPPGASRPLGGNFE